VKPLDTEILRVMQDRKGVTDAEVAFKVREDVRVVQSILRGLCAQHLAVRDQNSSGVTLYALTPAGRHAAVSDEFPAGTVFRRKGQPTMQVEVIMVAWSDAHQEFDMVYQPLNAGRNCAPVVRRFTEFLRAFEQVGA
jgi:predicted transcriptional regulator